MQQENDPKHRSKSTTPWHQQKVCLLESPSQTKHLKNFAEKKQLCKGEWSKIRLYSCAGLICHYRKCLVEVEPPTDWQPVIKSNGSQFFFFLLPVLSMFTYCAQKKKNMEMCLCSISLRRLLVYNFSENALVPPFDLHPHPFDVSLELVPQVSLVSLAVFMSMRFLSWEWWNSWGTLLNKNKKPVGKRWRGPFDAKS